MSDITYGQRSPQRKRLATMLGSVALVLCAPSISNAEEPGTETLQAMSWAAACVTCHGAADPVQGAEVAPLAGVPADVIIKKMKRSQDSEKEGGLMKQIALGYDDATIEAIANWYAEQGKEAP